MRPVIVLILALVSPLAAAVSPLSGDEVALGDEEGLLLLAFDSNMPIAKVSLRSIRQSFPVDVIDDVAAGAPAYYLYRLPAGEYYLSTLVPDYRSKRRYFHLPRSIPTMQVVAGRVNYPGTLILRLTDSADRGRILRHNRSSGAIAWLQANFARIHAALPFAYSGHQPDDFAAWLRRLQSGGEP